MKSFLGWKYRNGARLVALACVCSSAGLLPVQATDEPAAASIQATPIPPHHQSALDQRVKLLTAELGLDAQQQAEVRRILEDQRRQVMQVWNDTSVPAAYRVNATRTISDRTGDRIRALLNDEQKEKYNKPRKPRAAQADSQTLSVEDWMQATSPK